MFDGSHTERKTSRVIREGQAEPVDDLSIESSVEERIEAVWNLTKLCLAWRDQLAGEPRLQRTVTHLQRSQR